MASDQESTEGAQIQWDSQLMIDGEVYAGDLPAGDLAGRVTRAYHDGALQILKYFSEFKQRVEDQINESKATDFERGQLDGIRWVDDYLSHLLETK